MSAALRHWNRELNLLLNTQDDLEAAGKKVSKSHLARVRFVAACIEAHKDAE